MKVKFKIILLVAVAVFGFSALSKAQDSISLVGKLEMTGLPLHDVWGYTDSVGNKYALVAASTSGLRIIDLADLSNPVLVGSISGNGIEGIDVKTWKNYAYMVAEVTSVSGRVIDLSDPANPVAVGTFPGGHNITISDSGYMYLMGPGIKIFDLNADPTNPVQVYNNQSCPGHDASIIGTRLFLFSGFCGTKIYDVSRPDTLVLLGSIPSVSMYHHSGWTSPDGNHLFICDELASVIEDDITAWDISDLQNPVMVGSFTDSNAYVHNLYVRGDYAYVSYYKAGFRVFDISDPANMVLVDTYDTDTTLSGPGFGGNFGVFTFWGRDSILASDENNGLYVFSFSGISTGIEKSKSPILDYKVYPNPVNDVLIIENTSGRQGVSAQIFNATGVLIKEFIINGRAEVSTASLKQGIYFVSFTSGNELQTGAFVVKH